MSFGWSVKNLTIGFARSAISLSFAAKRPPAPVPFVIWLTKSAALFVSLVRTGSSLAPTFSRRFSIATLNLSAAPAEVLPYASAWPPTRFCSAASAFWAVAVLSASLAARCCSTVACLVDSLSLSCAVVTGLSAMPIRFSAPTLPL
jgi:hypothetical protein